jgi:hypothetical protein
MGVIFGFAADAAPTRPARGIVLHCSGVVDPPAREISAMLDRFFRVRN